MCLEWEGAWGVCVCVQLNNAEVSVLMLFVSVAQFLIPLCFAGIPGGSPFVSFDLSSSYPRGVSSSSEKCLDKTQIKRPEHLVCTRLILGCPENHESMYEAGSF